MLELEKLNGQTFDDIVETAVRSIARFDTSWNNLQAADPGMTLVDLFAWLKAVQHEYMSVIVPESQRRFLSLLDIRQRRGRGARTLLELSGARREKTIPAGTKWIAGDMVFENIRPAAALPVKLTQIVFQGNGIEQQAEPSWFDGARVFDIFPGLGPEPSRDPDGTMTLYLSGPVSSGTELSFYVELSDEGHSRVQVGEEDFFPMADICWESLTDAGWTPADTLRDDTHQFLFSGLITLRLHGTMTPAARGYALRARLVRDDYDLAPKLLVLRFNVIEVVQQDTQIQCSRFPAGQEVVLDSALGLYGRRRVFLAAREGEWRETENYQCIAGDGQVVITLPNPEGEVLVVSCQEEAQMVLGSGTGFSGQQVPFPIRNVLYDSLELLVGRRKGKEYLFSQWENRDDLYSSTPFSRHFVWNTVKECICFGDHERGMIPPKGENNILLAGLKTCQGKASEIQPGRIAAAHSPDPEIAALYVNQFLPATGGEDPETFEETAARAGNVLRSGEKAVTREDYLEAVRSAPGLLLHNCGVFAQPPGAGGCRVTVVVEGAGRAFRVPREPYAHSIRAALDRRRLLNTQVQVVWPRPVGLVIRGRIAAAPYYRDARTMIQDRITEFIETLNQNFGAPLSFGELYCAVDLLECVTAIQSLRVEPVGEFTRTGTDDILIPPNGTYEIRRFELDCFESL